MAPKFGTSGLRGLVVELTPDLVTDYTAAFLATCGTGDVVHVGWDLRPSSPAIAEAVIAAITQAGRTARVHGPLPTPALALAALGAGDSAVMITGSHIPADRNGLKFYTPRGEITKPEEAAILRALETPGLPAAAGLRTDAGDAARRAYVARYVTAFGARALDGLRIGVYEHSSVARDIMAEVVEGLGGTALRLARSEVFVPVDTEAVDPETRDRLAGWCADHRLDALISTDGDADRPMVADATGALVPGDVLGPLTARILGTETVCTPISSNTLIAQMPEIETIHWTRIGSPFVIAAMEAAQAATPGARIAGYEANGGFLLGTAVAGPAGPLAPLMTRDCLLPMLAPLVQAHAAGMSLADLVATLPARFTAADRLQGIAPTVSGPFLDHLSDDAAARAAFCADLGPEASVDRTDGLRMTFADGAIVHLRPSGNAPEFRCYVEAETPARARDLLARHLDRLRARLG
ncbi:phosphomannomutase [Jannaschia sp. M317]|uniref:phosphomannomutase n=1 Tax=Jannaschia sp. M317 TaxID=2867011 RepID=UPI0021A915FD|nr:phosphomannomutase [Jannaschia sp. M317]UWQ19652.1 phosphomannomutase [Jannaschia sp. M317]